MTRRLWLPAALALAAAAIPARSNEPDPTTPSACSLAPGPARTVTRIIDGETLALDDGKEVRLIGALSPRARDAGAEPGAWPLEEAAKTSLAELTLGKRVELAFGSTREDRYGRHLAHLFLNDGGQRLWVQGELLQIGLARAYALPGDSTCFAELIANEAVARTAGAGVWTSHLYAVRPAGKTFQLLSQRSTFQIVRGTVTSVTRSKSSAYLGFADDWHTDFTVSIPQRVLSENAEFGSSLETLQGKTIEVRGWIERRNGPMIAITSLAALKVLDGAHLTTPGEAAPDTDAAPGIISAPAQTPAPAQPHRHKQNRPKHRAPGDVDL